MFVIVDGPVIGLWNGGDNCLCQT